MDAKYWANATSSLLRNMRHREFAKDLAVSGLRRDLDPALSARFFLDVYPEAEGIAVDMGSVAYLRSNLDPMEQYVLAALTKLRQPRRIFEIGTYDGATTLLLAKNATNAAILTIDLPPEEATRATVVQEVANASSGAGSRFRGTKEGDRVKQLYGDSRSFDFSPWYGTVDLVLVDAGHEYDCAKPDTESAFRLLAPGGMIVWDDYQLGWPGVVRAVDDHAQTRPGRWSRIESTDFAVYEDCSY